MLKAFRSNWEDTDEPARRWPVSSSNISLVEQGGAGGSTGRSVRTRSPSIPAQLRDTFREFSSMPTMSTRWCSCPMQVLCFKAMCTILFARWSA